LRPDISSLYFQPPIVYKKIGSANMTDPKKERLPN